LAPEQVDSVITVSLKVTSSTNARTHTVYRTITIKRDHQSQYFVKDHLGSPRVVVDGKGNLLSNADYYPFGGIMPGRSGNNGMSHDRTKFTGYLLEEEGGQDTYHAEARGYDPVIGRFTSRDPLANDYPGWTPYHYTHNNPLNLIDPTGMSACDPPDECGWMDRIFSYFSQPETTRQEDFGGQQRRAAMQNHEGIQRAAVQAQEAVQEGVKDGLKTGIKVTDAVSDASTSLAVIGIATTPLHGGTLTTSLLAIGTGADATSLALKTIDAAVFDGSWETAAWQAGSMFTRGVAGEVVQGVTSKVVARTGSSVSGPLFQSAQTGRFVTNGFGHTVTAVSDATRVIIDVMIPDYP
jgi:RHS repeat-associated protein